SCRGGRPHWSVRHEPRTTRGRQPARGGGPMTSPYIGEIRLFGGNFAPVGWLFCSGQLLPISQYDALFNLIGTTYGGDGQQTFALPNLQSRLPVHVGTSYVL